MIIYYVITWKKVSVIIKWWITGQEASQHENGEVIPEAEFIPRKCDIITISGRAEKCELAKAALLVQTILFQLIMSLSHYYFSFFMNKHCWLVSWPPLYLLCLSDVLLLQALVPITEDVEVSYELHRYIIGQKGSGIRKMMEEYEVC